MNDYTCVLCGDLCKPAPTKNGWMSLSGLKAIHFDCLEHLWSAFEAMENRQPTTAEEEAKRLRSQVEELKRENAELRQKLAEANEDAERLAEIITLHNNRIGNE